MGQVYHHTPHDGLPKPESPTGAHDPGANPARSMARCSRLCSPVKQDLFYGFLEVHWRKIHHYGVEVTRPPLHTHERAHLRGPWLPGLAWASVFPRHRP